MDWLYHKADILIVIFLYCKKFVVSESDFGVHNRKHSSFDSLKRLSVFCY